MACEEENSHSPSQQNDALVRVDGCLLQGSQKPNRPCFPSFDPQQKSQKLICPLGLCLWCREHLPMDACGILCTQEVVQV